MQFSPKSKRQFGANWTGNEANQPRLAVSISVEKIATAYESRRVERSSTAGGTQ